MSAVTHRWECPAGTHTGGCCCFRKGGGVSHHAPRCAMAAVHGDDQVCARLGFVFRFVCLYGL